MENSEKNTFVAFERALDNGFGIETDVRDYDGKIVISHDLPNSSCIDMQLSHLLRMKFFSGACGRIALNIKSSGLAATVSTILNSIGINRHRIYAFDMSVPDIISYIDNDLDVYSRISDQEPVPAFMSIISGLWIDNLNGHFNQVEAAKDLLSQGVRVAIVSSELHGRNHEKLWDQILSHGLYKSPNFELCTDLPHKAANVFCAI